MKLPQFKSAILEIVLLGLVIPILGGYLLNLFFSNWVWSQVPFHAVVEAIGAFIAFVLATLLLTSKEKEKNGIHNLWIALPLIGMGLFDLFHSVINPGNNFVFFHSLATFFGGLLFCLVWFPARFATEFKVKFFPKILAAIIIIALFFLIFPNYSLIMLLKGQFTFWAKVLNLMGGIFFLFSAIRFVLGYKILRNWQQFLFAILCVLFGAAGILFVFSAPWHASWWAWHLLRLMAYFAALLYIFIEIRQLEEDIRLSSIGLAQKLNIK